MTDVHRTADTLSRKHRVEGGLIAEPFPGQERHYASPLLERMARLNVPGASVAVINDAALEWSEGFGLREAEGEEAVTSDTLFQAASISKPVTAIAVMRLVQEGRLDLDEDVHVYLRGWRVPANGSWQPRLTLRHLLSHTGGTTVWGFPGYRRNGLVPTLVQILDGQAPANTDAIRVNAPPGVGFRYSGGGTTIVQRVLCDVMGSDFPTLMRELVLDPLGMERSTFEQPLPPDPWGAAAAGHRSDGDAISGGWHVYPEMAAAGLWTTPAEVAQVALEVQRARMLGVSRIQERESADQMLTLQGGGPHGLGYRPDGEGGLLRFGHSGDNEGFKCDLVAYADRGLGAVVMTNGDLGDQLCFELLGGIAHEYDWLLVAGEHVGTFAGRWVPAAVDPAVSASYTGEYELRPDFRLRVDLEGDTLVLHPSGQPPLPLVLASGEVLRPRAIDFEVSFRTGDGGKATGLTLRQGWTIAEAPRLSEVAMNHPRASQAKVRGPTTEAGTTARARIETRDRRIDALPHQPAPRNDFRIGRAMRQR